jgi:hypothetical protein
VRFATKDKGLWLDDVDGGEMIEHNGSEVWIFEEGSLEGYSERKIGESSGFKVSSQREPFSHDTSAF